VRRVPYKQRAHMKKATLAIIRQENNVLLGLKKKGEIGSQTFNGPGGKCEEGESPIDCIIRETREEVGIELHREHLKLIAVITFYAADVADFEVSVFITNIFSSTPVETVDMVPKWFDITALPLDQMLESDREWFSKVVAGEEFRANVFYKERAKNFERIEFLPF
jgi:8-oxo-dGTP diphosphatase